MQDTYRHKGLRRNLVSELHKKGIKDKQVLEAMERVPRHLFLDNVFVEIAYENRAFPIGASQTISHPYTVAFQTELLQIKKGDKILEIGTGSGYQSAVLCEMKAKVYSIERQKSLFVKAKRLLPKMGYKLWQVHGDGYDGLPSFAPFNKILVTCGAPFIPQELLKQLIIGGLMVIPVGEGEEQEMIMIKKISDTEYDRTELGVFKFVPMLSDKERKLK
ncbi:MAG: protein-L-isoaspartate(D-aspartate) O-methyltransferase [Flavobacteriales bacterium]|jgi:protein-L-isoaspartate(D-aspartate) O-methyltransferase